MPLVFNELDPDERFFLSLWILQLSFNGIFLFIIILFDSGLLSKIFVLEFNFTIHTAFIHKWIDRNIKNSVRIQFLFWNVSPFYFMSQTWGLLLFFLCSSKIFFVSYTWFFLSFKLFDMIFNGSYRSDSVFSIFNVGIILSLPLIVNFKIIFRLYDNFIFWVSIWRTFNDLNTFLRFIFFKIYLINNNWVVFIWIFKHIVLDSEGTLCYFYWFLQNL